MRGKRPYGSSSSVPPWLIFLLAIAVVFGGYYVWTGVQNFMRTGGLGIRESTERARLIATATRETVQTREAIRETRVATIRPTPTDVPPCQDFVVIPAQAVIRQLPSTNSELVEQVPAGTILCVIAREPGTDWYLLDINPRTRRLDSAYIREDLVRAANPTLTPSRTFTALPTVTPAPTTPAPPASLTFTPAPTVEEAPPPSPTPARTLPPSTAAVAP
jgi:hypothetical protein